MRFAPVPHKLPHHLHASTLHDGPRLWAVCAFGGAVTLSATVGGVQVAQVMCPAVARAIAHEITQALAALGASECSRGITNEL